jgi:hypothetical protein
VSYSWVDPHFATLYARREEERASEQLAAKLRERAEREVYLPQPPVQPMSWFEQESLIRRCSRIL